MSCKDGTAGVRMMLVTALIAFAGPANAQPTQSNTKMMFEWCNSESRSIEDISCALYISGFVQGLQVHLAKEPSKEICLPDDGTIDGRTIFVRSIRAMKQNLKEDAYNIMVALPLPVVLWLAFSKEFPCHKSSN